MQQLRKLLFILLAALFITAPHVHGMNANQIAEQNDKNQLLIKAVREGDIECVRDLINNGSNVNTQDELEKTPLHGAAREGHTEMGRLLILNSAHVNAQDGFGFTPLYTAALQTGNTEIAKLLIDKGASVNAQCKNGHTPLHIAALFRKIEIAKLLIHNSANVDAQNTGGTTPLHNIATTLCNTEIAKLLIQNGADINIRENFLRNHPDQISHATPYQLAYVREKADITTLFDRISSLQNNDINAVITKDTPREDRIYYAQAMIAYGYCDVAHRIISEHLNKLSDDEYTDIMAHAIQHQNNTDHNTNINQFITNMRNAYEDEHHNKNKAQAVVEKVWNNVQDGHASFTVIAWVLRNYETQCGAFCDDDGNTIAHLSTSAQFNHLLPHIMTLVMQNKNHNPRNKDGKTPVMLRREIGNHAGADIIHKVVGTQNIFSPDERHRNPHLNHFIRQIDAVKEGNTKKANPFILGLELLAEKHKAQAEHVRSPKVFPPAITDHILAYTPGKQMPDKRPSQNNQNSCSIL